MTPANHKKIAVDVLLPLLHKAYPKENLGYFLMGNWLTDVSQGIAPVDYAAAMKGQVEDGIKDAKKNNWWYRYIIPDALLMYGANEKLKTVLGHPPPKDSKMAEWFTNVVYVAGWMEFCNVKKYPEELTKLGAPPLPFEEYDRIYFERFTQYFPHEHFDRFPMDRVEKSGRGLYFYLETDIKNIADLLTFVERDWKKYATKTDSASEKKRHDLMALLGHALHTTEDYWAHSNYVDFAMRALNIPITDADQKRKHGLRLKYDTTPRTEPFTEPGPTEDEKYIVAGYFDSVDTRFSVKQIYNYYYSKMNDQLKTLATINNNPFDWRKAETEDERKRCKASYAAAQDALKMPQKVRDAQFKYMEIDWYLKDKSIPMISQIMENMIKDGDTYAKKKFKDGTYYAERVGSHTLIAKDDDTKQPGFNEAMNIAKRVDTYIVETLLGITESKLKSNSGSGGTLNISTSKNIDWLDLLHYFLWHPAPASEFVNLSAGDNWWKDAIKNGGGTHKHVLKYISDEERENRAALSTRKVLELEHNSMIKIEQAKYLAWYNSQDGQYDSNKNDKSKQTGGYKKGEVKEYLQEDMDTGSVRVVCKKGSLKIVLYVAVWYEFKKIKEAQVSEGEVWSADFTEQSSVFDQDNKAVVTILEDGTDFDIDIASYDR